MICNTSYRWIINILLAGGCLSLAFSSCNKAKDHGAAMFEVLESAKTGLNFVNELQPSRDLNMFNYMYFYNGSGVGAGDFNNDGLTDLYFASNQQQDRLYINQGKLKFKDETTASGITHDGGWSTGVSVVDINNDGKLDIYVCRVGNFGVLKGMNRLLVCDTIINGIPRYTEKAKEYGLDFSGFSTQAAFLDYDLDGDLDCYLMNHSLRYNSTFQPRRNYTGTRDSLSGDRLYRNDGNRFTDISGQAGIQGTVIGYGLGIVVSDINMDGWPDLYIGNDFHENDYLYINQRNGSFREVLTEKTMHSSQFSMGVDAADINNDALPEIISLDMLPEDPYILRRSLGEDSYDLFQYKVRTGYHHQYARNTLQLNRGNGMFSEIGLYAGVAASDWSWGALFLDFDNDGWKDLFISNGIPKRLNDIDYVNYVSDQTIQQKIRGGGLDEKEMAVIEKFPEIKIPNKFYLNKKEARFEDLHQRIRNDHPTFSNGTVYADLDNDGDLDLVVNNIAEPALIYKNLNSENSGPGAWTIHLQGGAGNRNAVGARLLIYAGGQQLVYEKYPVKGFQSSMELPLMAGKGLGTVDSAFLIWPDQGYQKISLDSNHHQVYKFSYQENLPRFDFARLLPTASSVSVTEISALHGINHLHIENSFPEFDREPLLPYMLSTEGPALSEGDLTGDGLNDIFIGSSKMNRSVIYVQDASGNFIQSRQPALDADSTYEDVDAKWIDLDRDGWQDLVVVSGGNEYFGNSEFLRPRVYLNKKGVLQKNENPVFEGIQSTLSCVSMLDLDGDPYPDMFLGSRSIPWEYGAAPPFYFMKNDGTGKFTDITQQLGKDLLPGTFVTGAETADLDLDGDLDLLICLQWNGIIALLREGNGYKKVDITDLKGWWNFIRVLDADNDGDLDIVAGNLGLNSRLKATKEEPVRLFFGDFDGNGKQEQLLTYFVEGEELPFANKAELEKQLPVLKKKFLYAEDFARASLNELFGSRLSSFTQYEANHFASTIFINEGGLSFVPKILPWEAQLTSYKTAVVADLDGNSLPDILLGGNFYGNNIQMGRYDADYGGALINLGNGNFKYQGLGDYILKGQVRNIRRIDLATGERVFLYALNNDSLRMFSIRANNSARK